MNNDETRQFLDQIRIIDLRFRDLDDQVKMQQAISSWVEMLDAEMPLHFAIRAVRNHYKHLSRRVMPLDINEAWRKAEKARREADAQQCETCQGQQVFFERQDDDRVAKRYCPDCCPESAMSSRISSLIQEIKESTK